MKKFFAVCFAALSAIAPSHAKEPAPPGSVIDVELRPAQIGVASVYANGDGHEGSKTANGERVNPRALTAAHRCLPFGTVVEVENLGNGRTVDVRINDRGPFVRGRIVDLTPRGAAALGFSGLAKVELAVVSFPAGASPVSFPGCQATKGAGRAK